MNNILKTLAAVIITVVILKVVFNLLGFAGWMFGNFLGLAVLSVIAFVVFQFFKGFTSRLRDAK